jgi:Transposase DDE domain
MPQRDQDNASDRLWQADERSAACWQELVEQRLPPDLEQQARQMKAFVRVRTLSSASEVLRAILCYVLTLSSLKQLSAWSRLLGLTPLVLSPTAWQKRLRGCGPWLLWLLSQLLGQLLPPPASPLPTSGRILLVDATSLTQVGDGEGTWRLHSAYDLLAGRLSWVKISDRHTAESLKHLPIQPDDIVVGDGAYSRAGQLLAVDEVGAFSLTRFSPRHLVLYAPDAPDESEPFRLDVVGWLRTLAPGTYERQALVRFEGKALPVRLIVVVPLAEQAEAMRRHKEKQARAKGRQLGEETLFVAGFHLLVTTLPRSPWPLAVVLQLYRARWQIEILFKRFKGVLDLRRLRWHTAESVLAVIAALLVGWLLIEDQAAHLRREIADAEPEAFPMSNWQLDQWAFHSLLQVIEGWYSPARLRALAPQLRPLFRQRRQRPLREEQRRLQFQALLAPEPDLVIRFGCSSA